MSVVRGFGLNGKSLYTNVAMPKEVWLNFKVDSTNTNGLGISSLKSNGYVRNVFMHTSATPGANDGYTNPNPLAGFAWVQFTNSFNYYLGNFSGFVSPTVTSTKIDNSALTVGQAYVITVVGNSTLAAWQAIGLPPGLTPTVGQSFIALTVGAGANTSTSRVQLPSVSGITTVEVVGDPNTSISNSNISSNGGAWLMVQYLKQSFTAGAYTPVGTISTPTLTMNSYTPAGTNNSATPPIFTGTPATLTGTISTPTFTGTAASLTGTMTSVVGAPANGSIVSMRASFDGSSVTIDGI